ncbi:MAG: hypothetical protein EXQ59_02260 [Acidobacteria bacterium]|nr:hypothetical protein [Acidobacteriota bacterium]
MPTQVPISAAEHRPSPAADSLLARFAGVLRSPRATFTSVAETPRWAAVLAVTLALTFLCGAILLETEAGRFALVDQWERTALAFGQRVDNARYLSFEDASQHGVLYAGFSALASGPILALGVSAVIFGVFNGLLRGTARFGQVLAIVAHAGVILAVRQMIATPLNYARETLASPTTLSVVFSVLDEASPLARFFSIVDLFVVWWVVALAVGVAVLYRRSARRLAVAFFGAYLALALVLALAMTLTGAVS